MEMEMEMEGERRRERRCLPQGVGGVLGGEKNRKGEDRDLGNLV